MQGKTVVLRFSVSPELANEYKQIAEREGITKNDLFMKIVTSYKLSVKRKSSLKFSKWFDGLW